MAGTAYTSLRLEFKDWLPVLGIILGWVLSQIASYYRDTREKRKLLTIAMFTLLYVYFDRVRYRQILRVLKTRIGDKLEGISKLESSPEEKIEKNNLLLYQVEEARQALLIDHPETESRNRESLSGALESISQVDSLILYKARSLIEDDYLYKNTDLSGLLDQPLVYLQSYESLLGSVESFNSELRSLIAITALRHSMLCYVRTVLFLWYEHSKLKGRDQRANKFFDDFENSNIGQAELNKELTVQELP